VRSVTRTAAAAGRRGRRRRRTRPRPAPAAASPAARRAAAAGRRARRGQGLGRQSQGLVRRAAGARAWAAHRWAPVRAGRAGSVPGLAGRPRGPARLQAQGAARLWAQGAAKQARSGALGWLLAVGGLLRSVCGSSRSSDALEFASTAVAELEFDCACGAGAPKHYRTAAILLTPSAGTKADKQWGNQPEPTAAKINSYATCWKLTPLKLSVHGSDGVCLHTVSMQGASSRRSNTAAPFGKLHTGTPIKSERGRHTRQHSAR